MLPNGNRDRAGSVLNGLTFQQQQVNFILGHSIQSLYQHMVKEPIPEHLQALAERLNRKAFLENSPQPEARVDET
ncbi:hypothetical protein IC232_24780 [Microvirga sp. BT688]|uniref:hypothetical protein n=1 Tax=Microvirga sp. TaxID=1873136 RepID=UPI001681E18F|nr:hypothetical protein [Microvirga sp.]MBD2749894.1 hypothetical protein [Microvirga sp.]